MSKNMILVLDFGGSQSQPIARKVRKENVYCEILPYDTPIKEIEARSPRGVIMVGSAKEVNAETKGGSAKDVCSLGVPVLALGCPAMIVARDMGAVIQETVIENRTAQVCFGASPCLPV